MLRLLIPFILAMLGVGAGIGAGLALAPSGGECAEGSEGCTNEVAEPPQAAPEEGVDFDYARFSNQFVIPVVRTESIQSLVVMSLTMEIEVGTNEAIFALEPKLRDAVLRVLFDHANAGGFNGQYTSASAMDTLRRSLREATRAVAGPIVKDVLIADVIRQDL